MLFGEFAKSQAEAEYPELWRGLVGAWSPCLSPRGGTVLRDLSGRRYDGSLQNTANFSWEIVNGYRALRSTGGTSHVTVPLASMPSGSQSRSVFAWVLTTATARQGVVGTRETGWILGFRNTTDLWYVMVGGATIASTQNYATNTWYHIGFTHDVPSTTATLYLNGKPIHSSSAAGGSAGSSFGYMFVEDNVQGNPLTGSMADVVAYDRAINANSVMAHFRLGPGGWATPRRRRWNYATAQTAIPYWVFARKNARLIGGGVS